MSESLHVVLGAGQVGTIVAQRLVARGHRVRVVRQSPAAPAAAGVEHVIADVRDPRQLEDALRGAEVAYHCVNPPYDRWAELLLPMTRGILGGAARSGARLVVLDCLYMYGEDTSRMNEETPMAPVSKKGEFRRHAAEEMLAANAKGSVPVAIGRASDWFGPGATNAVVFGDRFFRRVFAGKGAECTGDPDMRHSYSYTPDVADALVLLGGSPDARGVFMLPVLPAETTREVVARFAGVVGRPLGVSRIPGFLLRSMGLFQPILREVAEMAYQWRQPFVLDDRRFRLTFGVAPTPWEAAVATTWAWALRRYGRVSSPTAGAPSASSTAG